MRPDSQHCSPLTGVPAQAPGSERPASRTGSAGTPLSLLGTLLGTQTETELPEGFTEVTVKLEIRATVYFKLFPNS